MYSLFLLVASLRGRNFWKAGNAWIATIAIVLEAASPEILVGQRRSGHDVHGEGVLGLFYCLFLHTSGRDLPSATIR